MFRPVWDFPFLFYAKTAPWTAALTPENSVLPLISVVFDQSILPSTPFNIKFVTVIAQLRKRIFSVRSSRTCRSSPTPSLELFGSDKLKKKRQKLEQSSKACKVNNLE